VGQCKQNSRVRSQDVTDIRKRKTFALSSLQQTAMMGLFNVWSCLLLDSCCTSRIVCSFSLPVQATGISSTSPSEASTARSFPEQAEAILRRGIDGHVYPGAVAVVGDARGIQNVRAVSCCVLQIDAICTSEPKCLWLAADTAQ
jgi:hypothetical protein